MGNMRIGEETVAKISLALFQVNRYNRKNV